MKFLLLAFLTATTNAFTVVVCAPQGAATIADVEWAISNKRADLGLGGKGFWKKAVNTCRGGAKKAQPVQVVSFCRSDPYEGTGLADAGKGSVIWCLGTLPTYVFL
ncbi:uncharacterized protein RAG0_05208 [Rhynchosporium agropyri]|uniref:Uncharacterized protein n=1 Tax=Rhynchosporium agropyri TaxID=914238 RepID=A0A1E1KFR5_9HELO|nr:uncharacterized protein RAG0_05208 [Rhynchosporium agropyri]